LARLTFPGNAPFLRLAQARVLPVRVHMHSILACLKTVKGTAARW
jgi:hypothetical protein